MIARLEVEVEDDRVVRLASEPPLAAKVLAGPGGRPELLLVGAAASLLEGDRLSVSVRVGPGCALTVRTAAATIAHPCPGGSATSFDVHARLGPGARLAWLPEPLVACSGCRHTGRTTIDLDAGAVAVWSETVSLGRSGETCGSIGLRLDVELAGRPLLRDGLRAGPGAPAWDGAAVMAGARHVGSVFLLGRRAEDGGIAGAFHLAGPGSGIRALGGDGAETERRLAPARTSFLATMAASGSRQAIVM
ncbi:MAG: urease accessory protein UreD [Actinomycetota bacterium]|nr:urease accessory protein UreD [Actinomycetota bacterium]